MALKVLVAAVVFAGLSIAYYHVDRALETLRVHAPAPEETSKVGSVYMRQIDILCLEMLPRLQPPASPLRKALLCDHYGKLVPALFVIAALTGWCASVWLLAFQGKQEVMVESWIAFLSSFLLAIVAGVVSLLILKAPFAAFQIDNPRLESAVALPLLAGLFLRAFFDRLPDVLKSYMDRITGKNGKDTDKKAGAVLTPILLICALAAPSADAQVSYWRCQNPKDKCTAFTEKQKEDCPECLEWKQGSFSIGDVFKTARLDQQKAGFKSDRVAANFFAAAAAEKFHNFDIGGDQALPKASAIYKNPILYGFREASADEQLGSIVMLGDVAGVAVMHDGQMKIAYPSAQTGKINYEDVSVLAQSQGVEPKYLLPAEPPKR